MPLCIAHLYLLTVLSVSSTHSLRSLQVLSFHALRNGFEILGRSSQYLKWVCRLRDSRTKREVGTKREEERMHRPLLHDSIHTPPAFAHKNNSTVHLCMPSLQVLSH